MTIETKIVRQRRDGDCGCAALATMFDLAYEDVYVAVAKIDRHRAARGLTTNQLVRIAKELGYTLRRRYKFTLDEDEGIVLIEFRRQPKSKYHWAVLLSGSDEGRIVDPTDSSMMSAQSYMAAYDAVPVLLLVEPEQ